MKWIAIIWLGLLGGCAMLPAPPAPVAPPAQPEIVPFAMNGRVSISQRGEWHSAGLRWTHLAGSDEILLLAPLGQTAARVYRDNGNASLDSDGRHYQADDVETLMEQVLGWHLPLGGLHHWVLGMADAGRPAQIERDESGRIAVLSQDGWEVRYLRYADTLPARLQLTHEDLRVLLLIDEWDWDLQ
ncbi:MAG TPA: lipoprotein insertase outer membrane protein LolB [Gallionella sp.]